MGAAEDSELARIDAEIAQLVVQKVQLEQNIVQPSKLQHSSLNPTGRTIFSWVLFLYFLNFTGCPLGITIGLLYLDINFLICFLVLVTLYGFIIIYGTGFVVLSHWILSCWCPYVPPTETTELA